MSAENNDSDFESGDAGTKVVLEDLVRRDYRRACDIVSGLVREDRLRCRHLEAVAAALQNPHVQSVANQLEASLADLEKACPPSRESTFSTLPSLLEIVPRFRATSAALTVAQGLVGLAPGSASIDHSLRRSFECAQRLLRNYASICPQIGTVLIDGEGSFLSRMRNPIDAIVSFGHLVYPEVRFSHPDVNTASGDEIRDDRIRMFVELPYWYAIRHRHLVTLSHEIAYAWLMAATRTPIGRRSLMRRFAGRVAEITEILKQYFPSFSKSERTDDANDLAFAYCLKAMADAMAYSMGGPAYLFSVYFLGSLVPGQSQNDLSMLPFKTRIRCLVGMCQRNLGSDPSPWASALAEIVSQFRIGIDEGCSGEMAPRFEQDLETALTPLQALLERTDAWRSTALEGSDVVPIYVWSDITDAYESTSHQEVSSRSSLPLWRAMLDDCNWAATVIPTFLWSQYLKFQFCQTAESYVPMGRLAHPIWEGVLRPDAEPASHDRIRRGHFFEIRFYRLGPGTDPTKLSEAFRETREQLIVARVLGEWDAFSIREGYSSTHTESLPIVKDQPYTCEQHVGCELIPSGASLIGWKEKLAQGDGTYLISQMAMSANTTLPKFHKEFRRAESAMSSASCAMLLNSLGWEDIIVLWKIHDQGGQEVSNAIHTLLESRMITRSVTQVVLPPQLIGPNGLGDFCSAAPSALRGTAKVEYVGVRHPRDMIHKLKTRYPRCNPRSPWGVADVIVDLDVEPKEDLGKLWTTLREPVKHQEAISVAVHWAS